MKTENNQTKKYQSLTKGLGITGLVLGILTLLISFIPVLGMFALFFGIIAVCVSLIGLVIALKNNHEKGLIVGAIICSLLGCGIAYSQYAVLNAVTDEFIKETQSSIKNNQDNTKNSKEKELSNTENEDIALVLDYIKKSKQNVTDENGLPLNYEYEIKWEEIKSLGKTKVYANKGKYRNALFLKLSVAQISAVLSLNGKHTKTVELVSHIYELNELNPILSESIPKEFTKKEMIYTPALDDISVQKEILKKVTDSYFSQSFLKKNENDKKVTNDWINATSDLIKSSNILNIKTVEDFNKIKEIKSEKKADLKESEIEEKGIKEKESKFGYTNGTNIIIRENHSTKSKIIGSIKNSGEKVEILESFNPNQKEFLIKEAVEVVTDSGQSYFLQKGKSISVLSNEGGDVKIQFKDKELNDLNAIINEKFIEKSSDSVWYKIKRENDEVGWVYGKFIILE